MGCPLSKESSFELVTSSPEETVELGRTIAGYLMKGDVISLSGQLGAGKTVFSKGIAIGLGIDDNIISPTFIILRTYQGRLPLYHFDAYRINNTEEFEEIGYKEFLYGGGVSLIEWGEKIQTILPEDILEISFYYQDKLNERKIIFKEYGSKWKDRRKEWEKSLQP